MSKFTRGPWEWVEDRWHGGYTGICGANNKEVLFPNHCNDGDDGDAWFEDLPSEADRNLIAAAPGLYVALMEALSKLLYFQSYSDVRSTIVMVRAAIAKADGEV